MNRPALLAPLDAVLALALAVQVRAALWRCPDRLPSRQEVGA